MTARKCGIVLVGMLLSLTVAACAIADQGGSWRYEPTFHAGGGTGEIYLAAHAGQYSPIAGGAKLRIRGIPKARTKARISNAIAQRWVIGRVENSKGQELGAIVSPMATDALLLDALEKELSAAGYRVKVVDKLPKGVGKGVALTRVSVKMDEVLGRVTTDGTCKISLGIDLWENGALVKTLTYDTIFSDFALSERNQIQETILRGALNDLMNKAIPDVIGMKRG